MARSAHKKRKLFGNFKLPLWSYKIAGFLLIKLMNAWLSTLNLRMWRHHPNADPGDDAFAGPALYIFWHEYIPLPIFIRPNSRLTMLLSQHQDAEVLSYVARYAGMEVVRGSTFRGGTTALRKLMDNRQDMSLAIVPDGPRGPRRQLAQGCVYVSSRLQIPIVLLGMGYDRPWRVQRAWDKFAIPRPFSRARVMVSPRIQVPPNLSREELEQHRQWIQQQLSELTQLAEDWAERRCTLPGSENLYRHGPRHLKSAPQQLPLLTGYNSVDGMLQPTPTSENNCSSPATVATQSDTLEFDLHSTHSEARHVG